MGAEPVGRPQDLRSCGAQQSGPEPFAWSRMTAPTSPDPEWTRRRDRGVLTRTWGDELVVYDSRSGSTHLLDPLSTAVLAYLQERDGSASAISRALLAEFDADSEEDALAAVRSTLAKLRDLNLVQPAAR